ncbi:hypothetical protein [Peribacillus simplex]|uniref:TrbC/VIRB2 family protein n=1 Tax=Peribacillus simplex TaxID=1478 RepID=A0AAN2TRN7_9BACI|nr:hypothetical protein [Peribacillus simplex]CEG31467.1 hypothetical protein BN1180_01611 [Peribacillus simplex]
MHLFNSNKIVTVGKISEVLNPEPKVVKKSLLVATGTLLPILFASSPKLSFAQEAVTASTKENVSQSIITAFNPLTDMVQGLAHPITLLAFTAAGLVWFIDKPKATQMMQNATIGFVLVQIAPLLMKMLVQVTVGF